MESSHNTRVPQWVLLAAAVVHDLGEVTVNVPWGQLVAIFFNFVLNDQVLEKILNVLEVTEIATSTDNRVIAKFLHALHALEPGHTSVRAEHVGDHHHTTVVLHGQDRRSRHDRGSSVGVWISSISIRGWCTETLCNIVA